MGMFVLARASPFVETFNFMSVAWEREYSRQTKVDKKGPSPFCKQKLTKKDKKGPSPFEKLTKKDRPLLKKKYYFFLFFFGVNSSICSL